MQKKVLIDAFSNIMMFDGKNLEALGKPVPLREIIPDKLYAFGNDLYLKSDDEYTLLAENAEAFSIGTSNPQAENQFKMIDSSVCLYIDKRTYSIQPFPTIKGYLDIFFPQDYLKTTPNTIIVQKGKDEHLLGIRQENQFSILEEEKAVGNANALFWRGGLYVGCKDMFVRYPIVIEHINTHFLIVRADASTKYTFAIFSSGQIKPLGIFNGIRTTSVSEILSTLDAGFEELWHLDKNFMERIVSVQFASDGLRINHDGSILHSYKTDVGSDNGGIVDGETIYRLSEDGHYTSC